MKQWKLKHLALAAMVAGGAVMLVGCEAQGDKAGITDGDAFPNNGSAFTLITENGTQIEAGKGFVCTKGARDVSNDLETKVVTLGVIGGPGVDVLDALDAQPVASVAARVLDKAFVIDNDLASFATFQRALDLAGVLTTVDEVVRFNDHNVKAGTFAVFGISFPDGVLEASVLNRVVIHTFRNHILQETAVLTEAARLDLLGLGLTPGYKRAFIGLKTTQDFDAVTIGTVPLLSANLGESLRVHELCTDGDFVTPPAL